jgi:hypothetical protein
MSKDERMRDTIDMAREAGFTWEPINNIIGPLERFEALVRAAEREACAKWVDHILKEGGGTWGDAIRARGETK